MRWLACMMAAGLCLAGCRGGGGSVLGQEPDPSGATVGVPEARRGPHGGRVKVRGRVVEKCPTAGCWFVMESGGVPLKVDTKTAGFVVLEVPLGAEVVVQGRRLEEGTEPVLAADGLIY